MAKTPRTPLPSCGSCVFPPFERICSSGSGKSSKGCATLTRKEILGQANEEYESPEIGEFARQASIQEASCYANRHERPYVMQPTRRTAGPPSPVRRAAATWPAARHHPNPRQRGNLRHNSFLDIKKSCEII